MKKVLLLGSMGTIFIHSYKALFERNGYEVFTANTNPMCNNLDANFNFYDSKIRDVDRVRRFAAKTHLDRLNLFWLFVEYVEQKSTLPLESYINFKNFIVSNSFDLIFCFWGTTLKKEIRALKLILQSIVNPPKLVLSINTYPVRYELSKKITPLARFYLKRDLSYFNSFDGLICPTVEMENLLVDLGVKSKIFTTPDFLDVSFFGRKNISKKRNSLIFLGNVDFQRRYIVDVSKLILNIAQQGVNVYVQSPCNLEHRNIKTFAPFTFDEISKGKLGDFISEFSASIILYNNLNNLRTSLGYPTRFALATLGNTSFILPAGVFDSLESILDSMGHKNYYTFNSIAEVKEIVDHIDTQAIEPNNSSLFNFSDDFFVFLDTR